MKSLPTAVPLHPSQDGLTALEASKKFSFNVETEKKKNFNNHISPLIVSLSPQLQGERSTSVESVAMSHRTDQ